MEGIRLYLVEVWLYWRIFTFWQILARRRIQEPASDALHPPDLPPLLLVHGVWCNGGVWTHVRRMLFKDDVQRVYAMSYEPPHASIEVFAEQLARRIDAICAKENARQVILIAHSMGGLVSRAYLRRYGTDRIATLITLATPHYGSELARFSFGTCMEQMRPISSWLAELNKSVTSVPIVSIYSLHDNLVAPQASAALVGARLIALKSIGHLQMLIAPEVYAQLRAELGQWTQCPYPNPLPEKHPSSLALLPVEEGNVNRLRRAQDREGVKGEFT